MSGGGSSPTLPNDPKTACKHIVRVPAIRPISQTAWPTSKSWTKQSCTNMPNCPKTCKNAAFSRRFVLVCTNMNFMSVQNVFVRGQNRTDM